MRIPGPAWAFTGGESLPALHGPPDHGEFGQNRGLAAFVIGNLLLAAALALPPGPVLRGFEPPPGPYARGHRGVDVAAQPGDQVVAAIDGVVTFVGRVNDRQIVSITQGTQIVSVEPVVGTVGIGTRVAAGDVIGIVDVGGHCSLRCVHIGIRVNGMYVDPLRSRRRLLPISRWRDVAHTPER